MWRQTLRRGVSPCQASSEVPLMAFDRAIALQQVNARPEKAKIPGR
jgi:hypothetical protein